MGKPRDTKIAILPSTTRKGTTLSTSAALDSPSVIDKLVSPPHASRAGTSAESENSHNIDNVSAVLDDSGSLGSFLDATIAKSRQIENTETPNATTPVKSPELDYSSDDPDEDYVELDDDFIEKCNATTDARKIKKLLAEHAVRYKPSPDPKFATSPINIRDKDYDFSLDLSHIAIVEKTPFCGTEKESAVEHLTELSTLSGVFSDDVKMRTYFVAKIFPFSLKDDAKTWYNNLPPGSIKSPTDLRDVFFRKYFPASAQHAALQRIYNFDQEDGEKLPEAWARFCSLIRAQPDHDLEKHDLLDIFYSGLTIESRAYLDSCAGCVFRKRTPDDAEELLAKIGRNHDDWSTPEPTPTPIVKKRGMIKLNDEDMREAKKSLKEKGIKPEDVKNLPPIEDICETIPPSSMIEDPLYPEGHPKRVEQDSQLIKTSAPSKKKKKKHKNVVESSEPVNDPNSISISDAETESGNEHEEDNDKNDAPDKEEIEKEPEKHAKNKKYTKEDFITEKHGAVIDCNKGMVTFNVDDKEHTVYFPKRIDKTVAIPYTCGSSTFDPESIEPAAPKASEEPSLEMVHGPLQRLKALLSSSVEILVENPEAIKGILDEIQPHLPVTLRVKLWPAATLSAFKSGVQSARQRITLRRAQLPLRADIAEKCQRLNEKKTALDAKTDTSANNAELETLRKELESLEEKVRMTKQLIQEKETFIARSREEAQGLTADLKTDLAEIRALSGQLVTGKDEDDETKIAEVDRIRTDALRALDEFLQKNFFV
ncbi:hypothetical protein QYE76_071636 [Lolium multiflorum]|uniref:Retrotransposon gag domain-containing protein n=1 Tax=Lolium multiflorum TaxID=4521 RepID=A0AAD8SLY9_LOLMU|nr:hypothetical protein QYE76_071636 [Lolium multiflorum]